MTTTHPIGTGVVLALALTLASAGPAGARPFDLNANGSEVPAGSASMPAASQPTGVPPPAAGQTQAQPAVDLRSPDARDAANPAARAINAQGVRVAHGLAARDSLTASPPPPLVITASRPNGFAWGDAGIGAAAGLVLTILALGGAIAVSRYRGHRTHDTTPALTT
jgi:hypothetical protein